MISTPPNNNQATQPAPQAPNAQHRQAEANTLHNRYPGWSFMDAQYGSNGVAQKAHIKDQAGHIRTVWFDAQDHVARVADGRL